MRKLMNKKGFSLVELMIVVVIMGILIAVAIPLYGAITENANNKTCANNIKTIKSNAAAYKTNYNQNVGSLTAVASMFEDNAVPECPLSDNDNHTDDYKIGDVNISTGAVKVECKNINDGSIQGKDKHQPSGSETVATELTGGAAPVNPDPQG